MGVRTMDERNFDRFTLALTGEGSTRRRVVGGLAALLGIAGIGGLDALDAEAKKNKNKKNKKKIRRLRRRLRRLRRQRTQNNQDNGVTIVEGATNLFPAGTNLGTLTLEQVLSAFDDIDQSALEAILGADVVGAIVAGTLTCDSGNQSIIRLCATGFCNEANGECASCPSGQICGDDDGLVGLVCCIEGAVCADVGCILD